jgi:hypothetical protein
MNSEILNQIQILNQNIGDLAQKSQGLIDVLNKAKGLDVNTIITVLAGLIGVIIGSYISYFFTKRMTNESSKARFAIQRKNLIYSKIYKELTYIREQVEQLPDNWFYFQVKTNLVDTKVNRHGSDTYWLGGKHDYIAPEFYVWKDIKSDIRITQVNNKVLNAMNALEKALINYFSSINQFEKELKTSQEYQQINLNLNAVLFFCNDFNKEKFIEEDIKRYDGQTTEWVSNRREQLLKVISPLLETPLLQESKENFLLLKKELDTAYSTLEKVIKDVVNKYEYGEKI